MAEELLIRFASAADLDFLQQARSITAQTLERKIDGQEIIVAERDGSLIGSLQLEYLWDSVPYISLIHVLPMSQRRGVGKAMLGYVEAFLRGRGHRALYSSSQADEPEPQAWHRHVCFEECGHIAGINEGGVGEIFFRKRLPSDIDV